MRSLGVVKSGIKMNEAQKPRLDVQNYSASLAIPRGLPAATVIL